MGETEAERKAREIDEAWRAHDAPYRHADMRREWLRKRRAEQHDCCFYCGVSFENGGALLAGPTLDHRVPLSRGGEDCFENVVAACQLCNNAKGNMLPDQVPAQLPRARVRILERHFKAMA